MAGLSDTLEKIKNREPSRKEQSDAAEPHQRAVATGPCIKRSRRKKSRTTGLGVSRARGDLCHHRGWRFGAVATQRLQPSAGVRHFVCKSKPAQDNQYYEDDQDDTDDTDAAVTVAVSVAAEAATEATKQEDDE